MLPKVVILGRPNVGKSSLFNLLAGRRISIVDPTPGVTRDRVSTYVKLPVTADDNAPEPSAPRRRRAAARGRRPRAPARPRVPNAPLFVELIDTGGYGIQDAQNLTADIERQIQTGLGEADLILFVVDAQAGLLPLDAEIARLLRQRGGTRGKPVRVVANKVDSPRYEAAAAEAARLGLGDPVLVSARSAYGKNELYAGIRRAIDWSAFGPDSAQPDLGVLLAIVGKRNAGKSTLVNALAGQERMIVSEVEGTTRDSVDVRFEMGGRVFTAIDTAGLRKTKSLAGDIEFYSRERTLRSIRRAHVVLLLIDAAIPVSHVDQQIAEEVLEHDKPVVVVVNKWDLAQGRTSTDAYADYFTRTLAGLNFAPIVFLSARQGEGLHDLVAMAFNLHQQAGHRVGTGELNRAVQRALEEKPPTSGIGRHAKIFYLTQTGVHPPTIALFVNDPSMFDPAYRRYLVNRLRDMLPFSEVPIRLHVRRRTRAMRDEAQA